MNSSSLFKLTMQIKSCGWIAIMPYLTMFDLKRNTHRNLSKLPLGIHTMIPLFHLRLSGFATIPRVSRVAELTNLTLDN